MKFLGAHRQRTTDLPASAYISGVPDNQGLNAQRRCAPGCVGKRKGEFQMTELVTVLRAADAAARWHVHQRRKGAAQEPYVTHLIEVAMLVAEATAGADPNLVVAALLHDTIEDQGVTREEIAAQFGDDVAALVVEVTDNKKLPKAERKRLQIKHASKLTTRAKILKLADKISNLRSMTTSPPADWPMQRRADYVTWTTQVVQGLRGTSGLLEQQFDRAAADWDRDRGIIE
jgi:(p)ppGpp synthase/HD superfamily hydrolase